MELLEQTIGLLPEALLALIVGFQAFLFKQVSEARREHLELRIEIANNHPKQVEIDHRLDQMEGRIEKRLDKVDQTLTELKNTRIKTL